MEAEENTYHTGEFSSSDIQENIGLSDENGIMFKNGTLRRVENFMIEQSFIDELTGLQTKYDIEWMMNGPVDPSNCSLFQDRYFEMAHDMVCLLVAERKGYEKNIVFERDVRFKDIIPSEQRVLAGEEHDLYNKSPDFLIRVGDTIKWCEVGVSHSHQYYLQHKMEKYKEIKSILQTSFVVDDEYLVCDRTLSHIHIQLSNISGTNEVSEVRIMCTRKLIMHAAEIMAAVLTNFSEHLPEHKGFMDQPSKDIIDDELNKLILDSLDDPDLNEHCRRAECYLDYDKTLSELSKCLQDNPDIIDKYKDNINTKEEIEKTDSDLKNSLETYHEGFTYIDDPRPSLHCCYFKTPVGLSYMPFDINATTETNFILQVFDLLKMVEEVYRDQKFDYTMQVLNTYCAEQRYKESETDPTNLDLTKFIVITNTTDKTAMDNQIRNYLNDEHGMREDLRRSLKEKLNKPPLKNGGKRKFAKYTVYKRHYDDAERVCGKNMVKFVHKNMSRSFEEKPLKKSKPVKGSHNKSGKYIQEDKISLKLEDRFLNDVDDFLSDLSLTDDIGAFDERLCHDPIEDSNLFFDLKVRYNLTIKKMLACIQRTRAFRFSTYMNNWSRQMIHYGSNFCPQGKAHLFTAGKRGHVTILGPGMSIANTNGVRPFIQIFVVEKGQKINSIFGRGIDRYPLSSKFDILITNWRSLASFKIYHIMNSFSASLGVSIDSLNRHLDKIENKRYQQTNLQVDPCNHITESILKQFYVLPTVISMCTSYETCRILGDSRYILMNSSAWLSKYRDFVMDKYAPPYKSSMDVFLVRKVLGKASTLCEQAKLIKRKAPSFIDGQRLQNSLGGKFILDSVYTEGKLYSLQDFLFEMFLSVLTPKESTSLHHKYISAVKVMKEYQGYFEKHKDFNLGFKDNVGWLDHACMLLKEKPKVGFSYHFLYNVAYKHGKTLNAGKIKKLRRTTDLEESIGNLSTTKGSVDSSTMSKQQEKIVNDDPRLKIKGDGLKKAKVSINLLRRIISNGGKMTHRDGLLEFVKKRHIPNIAIAIKAQYGAKREFYIQDEITRIATNLVENTIYKPICTVDAREAITIRGDNKLIDLEDLQNNALRVAAKNKNTIKYGVANINGDSSKWSAKAVMGEFLAVNDAYTMCDLMSKEESNFCELVFRKWTLKKIQVPQSIMKNMTQEALLNFDYDQSRPDRIVLNSNFLQGFFNYASSSKHSAAMGCAVDLFDKTFPDRAGNIRNLGRVHSDDYTCVVLHKTPHDLILFRSIQKIAMTLCGIADSEKKTNVHLHFQEFVSLFLFNTSLNYPTIKVAKDVGYSLPCTGYKDDMFAAISHSTNYLRKGGFMNVSYFLQRLANIVVSKSYGMKTELKLEDDVTIDRRRIPIEIGGMSDTHPILYLLAGSSANNYRLYSSRNRETRKLLWGLLPDSGLLDFGGTEEQDFSFNEKTFTNLYTLKFTYAFSSDIEDFREEFPMDPNFCQDFWKQHPCYQFLMPRDHDFVRQYMLCKLYTKQYAIAFSRQSRVALSLRISHFSARECVEFEGNTYTSDDVTRIIYKRCMEKVNLTLEDDANLHRLISNSNNLLPMLDHISLTSSFDSLEKHDTFLRVERLPRNFKPISLSCRLEEVLQYRFYKEDYEKDGRTPTTIYSMESSIAELERHFNLNKIEENKSIEVPLLYKLLSLTQKTSIIMLTPCRRDSNIRQVIKETLSKMSLYGVKVNINMNETGYIVNPLDFSQKFTTTTGELLNSQDEVLNNMQQLFIYCKHSLNMKYHEMFKVFSGLLFSDNGDKKSYYTYLSELTIDNIWVKDKKRTITNLAIMKLYFFNDDYFAKHCIMSLNPYLFYYKVQSGRDTITGSKYTVGGETDQNSIVVVVRYGSTVMKGERFKGEFRFFVDQVTDPYTLKNAYLLCNMLIGGLKEYAYDFTELYKMQMHETNIPKVKMSSYDPRRHLFKINDLGFVTIENKPTLWGIDNLYHQEYVDFDRDYLNQLAISIKPNLNEDNLRVMTGESRHFGWRGTYFNTSLNYTEVDHEKDINKFSILLMTNALSRFLRGENLESCDKVRDIVLNSYAWNIEIKKENFKSDIDILFNQEVDLEKELAKFDFDKFEFGSEHSATEDHDLDVEYEYEYQEVNYDDIEVGSIVDVKEKQTNLLDMRNKRDTRLTKNMVLMSKLGEIDSRRMLGLIYKHRKIGHPGRSEAIFCKVFVWSELHMFEELKALSSLDKCVYLVLYETLYNQSESDITMPRFMELLQMNRLQCLYYLHDHIDVVNVLPLTNTGKGKLREFIKSVSIE